MPEIKVGDKTTLTRTFTKEEVLAFSEISRDRGVHHLKPNAQDHLIVHGLLLSTLPTEAGGQLNFLARELRFEFHRPAWTGVPVRCELVVDRWEPVPQGFHLETTWQCFDPEGRLLMSGTARGLVPHTPP